MQQAEHITESEVDIEKKKQELYSEIDALGIKSDSRINKLKKFLADRKIWHLEEMDYPLRNSYEQYLRGQIRSQIVSFYLKIYDTVKQQHIYQQMQTLNGKRIYEWKYQNKIYFLKYYPEKKIAETFETSYKTNLLVWDFTQNCSEVLKKQIFYTLSRIIANTSMSKAYRNVRLKSLKLLYDSCVQLNITDVLELCDINPDDYCWHDLRHTYATLLKKNINNLKVISKLLGHSTVDMTEDVYFDDQRDIIDTSSIMTKYVDSLYDKIHMSDKSEELDMSKISDAFLKIR